MNNFNIGDIVVITKSLFGDCAGTITMIISENKFSYSVKNEFGYYSQTPISIRHATNEEKSFYLSYTEKHKCKTAHIDLMKGGFYNTNHEFGKQLTKDQEKAKNETQLIYKFYKENAHKGYSSDFVARYLNLDKHNTRRAISTLKMRGLLVKLEEMETGDRDKPIHKYQLKNNLYFW